MDELYTVATEMILLLMARLSKFSFVSLAALLFGILIAIYAFLASLQGYWRHDAWVYTESEWHEAIDGKFLAAPLHWLLNGVNPEIAMVAALCSLSLYLWFEFKRLSGTQALPQMLSFTLILSIFSAAFVSQLHWPIHALSATFPLLASLVFIGKRGPGIRLARCLVVTLGSLWILSSFSFFGPLCLIPEYELAARRPPLRRDADSSRFPVSILVVGLGWPFVLVLSYALTSLLKTLANRFGANLAPARLEAVVSLDRLIDIGRFISRFQEFALRQWGWFAYPLLIVFVIAALLVVFALCSRICRHLVSGICSLRACIIIAIAWILLTPVLASVASQTAWQRVALSWCSVPPLLVFLSYRSSPLIFRGFLATSALFAAFSSMTIGIYNFAQSALITRRTLDSVSYQVGSRPNKHTLYVLPLGDISALSPRYIWGGWPPFVACNPANPRLHRLFDEIGIKHYLVISECGFSHPSGFVRRNLSSASLGLGHSLPSRDLLTAYADETGVRLEHVALIDLSTLAHY